MVQAVGKVDKVQAVGKVDKVQAVGKADKVQAVGKADTEQEQHMLFHTRGQGIVDNFHCMDFQECFDALEMLQFPNQVKAVRVIDSQLSAPLYPTTGRNKII